MDCEQIKELLDAYALGAAEEHGPVVEAQRLRRQLAEHPSGAARQPSRQDLAVDQLERLRRGGLRGPQ